MFAKDGFNTNSTSVELKVPSDVTGIERIMLAAQGDLQRLLSAFFSRPISIQTIYAHTSPREKPASLESPILQTRQVYLNCSSRTVCVATSAVTLTTPECETLFLDDKFAIGQMFRKLGRRPQFSLLSVETSIVNRKRELRRIYVLETEGFRCEILEVFSDRDMFTRGAAWLDDLATLPPPANFFDVTPHSIDDTPTLPSILQKQAANPRISGKVFAAYPDATFDKYLEITYKEFSRNVDLESFMWYQHLSSVVGTSDEASHPVVALLADSSFHLAQTIISLLKLNATVFMLSPANSVAAIAHLIKTTNVSVLIYGHNHATVAYEASCAAGVYAQPVLPVPYENTTFTTQYFHFFNGKQCTFRTTHPEVPMIVHSSGSTAFPKAVRWSNTSFLANSQIMVTSGNWSAFSKEGNRFLLLGPLFHTMGLTLGLAGTVCSGSTIVFPMARTWPPSPQDVARSLKLTEVTTSIMVPVLLEQLADNLLADSTGTPEEALSVLTKMRVVIVGGAHCPDSVAERLVGYGINLKYVYGSSETGHLMVGSHERLTPATAASWRLVRPFPHTEPLLKQLDELSTEGNPLYQVHLPAGDVRLAIGVLKDGEDTWNTGDIIEEYPAGSGWYKILYREDDTLVHDSGEKTNPLPMELACLSYSKLISRLAIIGHRRSVTAAIIQLNTTEAQKYTEAERVAICKEAIRVANVEAPKHSRVLEEMIMVLPVGSAKDIPVTPKGNCIRKKVLDVFAKEIDSLYADFEDDSSESTAYSSLTLSDVQDQVSNIFQEISGDAKTFQIDLTKNLFDIGLDSVTAMSLRNRLSKSFGTKLSQQFVYQNSSLSLLAQAIYTMVASRSGTSSPTGPSKGEIISGLIEHQISIIKQASNVILANRSEEEYDFSSKRSVAVVGAAGSLGIWQVKKLLDSDDVANVVCLVRGRDANAVYDKIIAGAHNAHLEELAELMIACKASQAAQLGVPALELDQRLSVIPFDLANPKFDRKEYMSLANGLTTIIHTGWKMDFNQVVTNFDDCLNGTTQLLILASFMRPKQFCFISSIGVVMRSPINPVPETLVPWTKDDFVIASPHGYSESKFVAEYVIETAASLLDIPCNCIRIGQISGDTVNGVWKTAEMNPIIVAGSARVGKFPVAESAVIDWVPVDVVGATTVDLALSLNKNGTNEINHIVNPTLSSYGDLAAALRANGVAVEAVPPEEWWKAICADEGNPCLALEDYIHEEVVQSLGDSERTGKMNLTLDVSGTVAASASLKDCPEMTQDLWAKYIAHWRSVEFLP